MYTKIYWLLVSTQGTLAQLLRSYGAGLTAVALSFGMSTPLSPPFNTIVICTNKVKRPKKWAKIQKKERKNVRPETRVTLSNTTRRRGGVIPKAKNDTLFCPV